MTETDDFLKLKGVPQEQIATMSEYDKTELRRKIENYNRNHQKYYRPANLASAE